MASPPKRIRLCFLDTACTGGYMAAGQWKREGETSRTKDTLKYYTDLAKLAERGKVSAIFFADWYAGFDVYGGNMDQPLKSGHQVAHLDPLVMVSAMAAATESVSFAVTMSTSYANPYVLARQFSTLDHLTGGRCAWNVVTSWSKSSAQALGYDDIVPHDERYAVADEYMDVVYKLWESSWGPEAAVWDTEKGIGFDPTQVKKVEHRGKYFKVSGRNQVHPSPQRTPVLFQAGASKSGSAFAAKHAEAIFLNTATIKHGKEVVSKSRSIAASEGRDPASLQFFPCIVPYIGRTEEEAKAKFEAAKACADPVAGLAQFCGYVGIDMSTWPLDEPIMIDDNKHADSIKLHSIQSMFKGLSAAGEPWTPRQLGMQMALGGLHPMPVGTPQHVADVFEEWVREADVDGFNIASVLNPASWEDVVNLLVPELQKRGLMWEDYDVPGGTFRENLQGQSKLRDDHYGATFRWGSDKAKNVDKISDTLKTNGTVSVAA